MSANNITQLCQKAAKAFLDGENLSFITDEESQIVTGIVSSDIQLPTVICQCRTATSAVPFEGNWSATLHIECSAVSQRGAARHGIICLVSCPSIIHGKCLHTGLAM